MGRKERRAAGQRGNSAKLMQIPKFIPAQKTYTLTQEELDAIRRQAAEDAIKESADVINRMSKAKVDARIVDWEKQQNIRLQERWDEMKKLDDLSAVNYMLCMLFAVPTKILVDEFGWATVPHGGLHRRKLKRFADAMANEVNRIMADNHDDIRAYADFVYKYYGIRYCPLDEDYGDVNQEHYYYREADADHYWREKEMQQS